MPIRSRNHSNTNLADERGVREGWADIRVTIELAIALQLYIIHF